MSESQGQGANTKALCRAGKFLNFQLANEYYGLELFKVKEIIGMMPVTRVPNSPPYMRGVINLRGKVIPVVDLRAKFSMESKEDTERTCIIVMQIDRGGLMTTTGIIVDEVSEVVVISENQIEPAPALGSDIDTEALMGIGKLEQKVVLILDIDRVLSDQRIEQAAPPEA